MMAISGQSIAAAADSCTRNGKANTVWGTIITVFGSLALTGGCLWLGCHLKKKRDDAKIRNRVALENTKHTHRVDETKLKAELKKEIIDYRREQCTSRSAFNAEVDLNDETAYVETYDELVSGEDIFNTDLRLGFRCLHIGEDCGLVGRTNIGKTTFLMHLAIAIARGYQENGSIISPEWTSTQPMKVLYFAFEQKKAYFKTKYGRFINHIPNLSVEVMTSAGDFRSIQKKIMMMQSEIGEYRLLVIFDNLTKMKSRKSDDKRDFFQWLEDYRIKCDNEGKPITYLKVFHTNGYYKDNMPIDPTTIYGDKTDTFFTQDLVAFGMCKGGNGKLRYIKELKNKLEPDGEKQSLSVYRFADTDVPMYDYVGEFEECEVLPSKSDLVRGTSETSDNGTKEVVRTPGKRGRNEDYSHDLLVTMDEEHKAGFSWREIMEYHDIKYDTQRPDGADNKAKGIKKAMKRHGIR